MSEHENWIRYNAVEVASKHNKFRPIDKVLLDAKKLTQFILDEPKCEIKSIKILDKDAK